MKKKFILIFTIGFAVALGLLLVFSFKEDLSVYKKDYHDYLNTFSSIILESSDRLKSKEEVAKDLKAVEDVLLAIESNFSIKQTIFMEIKGIEKSTLMKINENSGTGVATKVDKDFMTLLKMALEMAELTKGGFDPTIGPLTALWNISEKAQKCDVFDDFFDGDFDYSSCDTIPTQAEIDAALALVDYKKVQYDEEKSTVYLPVAGMKLDFGAIAKGFAADKVLEFLLSRGYTKRIAISLGGNIYNYSATPTKGGFRTSINNPFGGKELLSFSSPNQTIVTSGISERYYMVDGVKYHHILNSLTGYPFDNELETVSIFHAYKKDFATSAFTDALATGVYSFGLEAGLEYINSVPGLEAVFVTRDKRVYVTEGLDYKIEAGLKSSYKLFYNNQEVEFEPIDSSNNDSNFSWKNIVYLIGFTAIGGAAFVALWYVVRDDKKKIEE